MSEKDNIKLRGSSDVSYQGESIDSMISEFMKIHDVPGLTLAIVQAPYIPRVVGYGMSDKVQKRLASPNTVWPAGNISQAFLAVAVMQCYEKKLLDLEDSVVKYVKNIPNDWRNVTIIQLLRHTSGIVDYRNNPDWKKGTKYSFADLCAFSDEKLGFKPGYKAEMSATNSLLLTEVVEVVSGTTYENFVKENQIDYLGLQHTAFGSELDIFTNEDVGKSDNVHQIFKKDKLFVNPTEPAASYDENGNTITPEFISVKGFNDIWASAQDISHWDIALAGSILIEKPENRNMVYTPWETPDGKSMPAVSGWMFYNHEGLMDIKGTVSGYSMFLSRFTKADELVCVTLLANKEGLDFTNLGRRIASCFGDLLASGYNENRLFVFESQFSVEDTVARLKSDVTGRGMEIFSISEHSSKAEDVGMELRPTTVVAFGSPKAGTPLMQKEQSVSIELPLRISVWEDEQGSVWLAFPWMHKVMEDFGLENDPTVSKMQGLLEDLVHKAGNVY